MKIKSNKIKVDKYNKERGQTLLNNIPEFCYAFKEDDKNEVIYISPNITGYYETRKKANTVQELLELNKTLINQNLSDDLKLELIEIIKGCSMFLTSNVKHYIKCKYNLKGGK